MRKTITHIMISLLAGIMLIGCGNAETNEVGDETTVEHESEIVVDESDDIDKTKENSEEVETTDDAVPVEDESNAEASITTVTDSSASNDNTTSNGSATTGSTATNNSGSTTSSGSSTTNNGSTTVIISQTITVDTTPKTSRAAFDRINEERVKLGLEPAVWSDRLEEIALLRVAELAEIQTITAENAHAGMDKFQAEDLSLGECVAYGYGSANAAVNGWMNSPAHKEILMTESRVYLAVAVVNTQWGTRWVAVNSWSETPVSWEDGEGEVGEGAQGDEGSAGDEAY